ncbi:MULTISPECIES: B3/B4 domain-containing protein [unclassified Jeotgalibaca]|uniref:B3/B4 domain-containing protein n=1 Tax=unclassified Jeotgalibaca TaxID=2621505 RepID=UPI003FD43B94
MKFTVSPTFWEVFPEGEIAVLVLKGINNRPKPEEKVVFASLLKDAKEESKQYLGEEVFSENEIVQAWREAYRKFKTKKGARSSIEALLKRVDQDREFTPINPLVDIYNSISLSFGVPCGGEDLDTMSGDIVLGKAQGGEGFRALGDDADAPALPEEIIYYDAEGAICRSLNWRDAQRTMLTENTSNAILFMEAVEPEMIEQTNKAMRALKDRSDVHFGVEGRLYRVTKDNPEITF